MSARLIDDTGAEWPITGTSCDTCRLPTDPALGAGPHPGCQPAKTLDATEYRAVLDLLADQLGATPHRPLDVWRTSGDRIRSRPQVPSPRTSTADTRTETTR